ncbi:PREDICTED: protein ECT2 isoform X4 [Nicrophorus vespilloides]|uniref:Protein ECT2 isoform X4 n=1 Tax=Nicrophorus vespilloides TaxID=110193 RepID=A0ABM1M284_NICVS|nr:PREDICTED: protein ECT2 isoform X4 [Nicrophorus vespilloides]
MDEKTKCQVRQQSIGSDSNSEDTLRNESALGSASALPLDKRICLVGGAANDEAVCGAAQSFGVPIVTSPDGYEYAGDQSCSTIFVLEKFQGPQYDHLCKSRHPLLGMPALRQLAIRKDKLPNNTRPLYTLAMTGVVVCFTGFRNKEDLTRLVPLVHHMGGSIRKEMSFKVTHLIANASGGEKYKYANVFRLPIMNYAWVLTSWDRRNDMEFSAICDKFVSEFKLKPFHGARVCFLGFPEEEEKHMAEILVSNGGTVAPLDDPTCTHVVVDESQVTERPDVVPKAHVVKAEWFWTSVQKEISLEEKAYLLMELNDRVSSPSVRRDSHQATPGSASRRKRKRLLETLAHPQQSPVVHHKRRSSISDAGLHSVSGSFLDCTASPDKALYDGTESSTVPDTPRKGLTARQQVFLELVQTESNYVNILDTIMKMFKKHLEEMDEEDALLNNTELKIIFGNVPLIFETHLKMLDELRKLSAHWSEEKCVGNVILKYSTDLLKAYPPFVNFFEEMKEMLTQCDVNKPRFHAFLKACQTRPECGRQGLQDLLIRPVQRLPSISLLLNDILKNTPKSNPDHNALDQALASIREVMTHINEDKRKTEGQRVMFDIFNDIDNCPPDLVSSHRSFIAKSEVVQLSSSEGLSGKGNPLVLFLFSDQLEICKKRSKAFNTMKSPNTVNGLHKNSASKPYKHIKLMSLSNIKRVIDIKETEDCQKVFGFVVRHNDELKERLFTFVMSDEDADKVTFLKTLCRQMATNACTADSDKFMAFLEPHDLDINTSDVNNGTLSKAFKFATRTRLKVGRAFSFNKTPSKLKRAVSSMISSPFGSSTNLTPASQLAQMRLASYNNISELGNADNVDSPPIAPLSVQPTRKLKTGSLGVSALKRL